MKRLRVGFLAGHAWLRTPGEPAGLVGVRAAVSGARLGKPGVARMPTTVKESVRKARIRISAPAVIDRLSGNASSIRAISRAHRDRAAVCAGVSGASSPGVPAAGSPAPGPALAPRTQGSGARARVVGGSGGRAR